MKTPPIKPPFTRNGGSAHAKVNGPKEGAAPVPAAEPKSSSETAAVTLTPAGKRPAKKGMPKRGGSSRGRLVYRPKKSKKVIAKKEEEEEPKATGEPGVADEAPLPETGANGGPNTDQSSELCCGPLEPMKLQRRRFQRLKGRSFPTSILRMMKMMDWKPSGRRDVKKREFVSWTLRWNPILDR